MQTKLKALGVLGFIGLMTLAQSVFVVSETEQVLIERFGNLKQSYNQAGLKFKVPFIDNVVRLEKRVLNLASSGDSIATLADKKQLVIDGFARYKITDAIKFYQAVRDETSAELKMATILDSATRSVLGKQTLGDVLSGERSVLMEKIRQQADKQTQDLGIQVIDVRIRRADLPKKNSESVFNRMRAERQQQATQYRAEGKEKATEIEAKARKESSIILANAKRDAEIMRGQGDAEANRIYAESYAKDADFFEFYRSLKAYERVLSSNSDTSIILSNDTDFMKYMNKGAR